MADRAPRQRRAAPKPGRIKETGQHLLKGSAPVVLVATSMVAAVTAIVGLTVWVAVAAAVTAAVSGWQVLRSELVVPFRIRRAENATAMVLDGEADLLARGSAFQIASGRWITAAHLVRNRPRLTLRVGGASSSCRVLHLDPEWWGLEVLAADFDDVRPAAATRSVSGIGDTLKIIGWDHEADPAVKHTYEYVLSGQAENNLALLAGPTPQPGFGGGPAIDSKTGRVIGVLVATTDSGQGGALISPLSGLPHAYL
ncbi:trypsin-like peptidase domain-containing protein [Streptomyces sp. NPDC057694]|uniref:trypsin-like peptidase domain-containing protein n=1 Tax=Streptomyces sp. NPDC057694 TaxID=3346216 RepID=UPI00367C78E8